MADKFSQKVAVYGPRLAKGIGGSLVDAAAVFGNIGWESAGMEHLQELGKRAGQGGRGWAMWTSARRKQFENYCRMHGLSPDSDEGNFGFLMTELAGSEAAAVHAMRGQSTLDGKVRAFCWVFERPGVIAMPGRLRWAREALAVMQPGHPETHAPVATRARRHVAAPMAKKASRRHRHA
jgi:hypothetical protein